MKVIKNYSVKESVQNPISINFPRYFYVLLFCSFAVFSLLSFLKVMSYLSLFFFAVYLLYLIASEPKLIVKYPAFYFVVIANIVGVASCEFTHVFLPEMLCSASFSGSLPLIVFSRWLFLVVIQRFDSASMLYAPSNSCGAEPESDNRPSISILMVLTVVVFCLTMALAVHVLSHPAFLMGVDRVFYTQRYLTGIWGQISGYLNFLILIPALSIRNNKSKLGIFTVALYLVTLVCSGVKFGGLFTVLCSIVLVYFDKICSMNKNRLRKYLFGMLAVFCALIVVTVTVQGTYSDESPLDYLADRTAQQGELWWKTVSLYGFESHFEQVPCELSALTLNADVSDSVGANYGIYNIMYKTVPSVQVDRYLAGGARYTEAGYATALYCLGPVGPLLFSVVMGIAAAFLQNLLLMAISHVWLIQSCLLFRFYNLLQTGISMCVFGQLFTPMSIASALIILLMYLIEAKERIVSAKSAVNYRF